MSRKGINKYARPPKPPRGGSGRALLTVELTAPYRAARHPDFDRRWAEHSLLVYWWAQRLARLFTRAFQLPRRGRWEAADFLGALTVRFNYALHGWDPAGARFSTYFSARIVTWARQAVVQADSDRGARTAEEQRGALEAYAYERGQRYHLYRTPEDFSWEEQMLELLGPDPWAKLTAGLPERARTVLEWRFRDGKTLLECGQLLGRSRERVRQIERDSLRALRRRVERYEPARHLFFGDAA